MSTRAVPWSMSKTNSGTSSIAKDNPVHLSLSKKRPDIYSFARLSFKLLRISF